MVVVPRARNVAGVRATSVERMRLHGKEKWRGQDLCADCSKQGMCRAWSDVFAAAAKHGLSFAVTVCENYDGPQGEEG